MMHAHLHGHPQDGERWKREARIAGQLDSRFIVDVLDVGAHGCVVIWPTLERT